MRYGMARYDMVIYIGLSDAEIVELWKERSSIMEHDGGLDRQTAERRAYEDIRKLIGNVPVPQEIRDAVRKKF